MRLELGLCGQVLRLGVCELRAEYLQQRLTTLHLIAEFNQHARDAARDERRDDDLLVGIRFNGAGDPHRGRAGGAPASPAPVSMPARFIASCDTVTTTSGSGTLGAGLSPLAPDCGVSDVDGALAGLAVSCIR